MQYLVLFLSLLTFATLSHGYILASFPTILVSKKNALSGKTPIGYSSIISQSIRYPMMPALQGSPLDFNDPLELCEEHVLLVLQEIRDSLGTLFGYDAKSREVGITGEIEYVECDGPVITVRLKGRFWHPTDTVMARVESYFKRRIPEVTNVLLSIDQSSIVDDNRLNASKRLT